MASSTILRVKRRLEDNPQDALVLLCKRAKIDAEEISPSLFVFRGTVESQDPINVKGIVPKEDLKLKSGSNVNDIIEKIRKERKEAAAENRYEIVKCSRGLKEADDDEFDLVDLQQKAPEEQADVEYAYDLYIAAKKDFDISMLDNLVSIENYETDLIFGSHRDNGRATPSSDGADDDDDSNDENNWRNDYPDEEGFDMEDLARALDDVDFGVELSSDEGEDEIYEHRSDLFAKDVERYGEAYAEYKARVTAEYPPEAYPTGNDRNFVHYNMIKDLDQESLQGYKDDSDDGFYYGEEEDTDQFREQYTNDSADEPD